LLINIFGNIIGFVPLGFFLPKLFSNKINNIKKFSLFILLILFTIEILQPIFKVGTFDVADIILNFLGCSIGYTIFKIESKFSILN